MISYRARYSWAASVAIATAGCTSKQPPASTSMPRLPATFNQHCSTTGTAADCLGALNTFSAAWSGDNSLHSLDDTTADRIDKTMAAKFDVGSDVAVPRKGKAGKKVWVDLETISDANLVAASDITHPVVIARLTARAKSDDDEDAMYGVQKDATYYVIIAPDADDGSTDDQSRWFVVSVKRAGGKARADIVRAGTRYGPCKNAAGNYDPQQAQPFGWFATCAEAHQVTLATLTAAKAASELSDSARKRLEGAFSSDLSTVLRPALLNDEPIWITCGLGCCMVTDNW